MKPRKDIKLNFDPKKHDTKVDGLKAIEETAQQKRKRERAMFECKKYYDEWKRQLIRKAKKEGTVTSQYVIDQVYALMSGVGKICKDRGVADWLHFTLQMLEDKIGQLVAIGIMRRNRVTQYVPDAPTPMDPENNAIVRKNMLDNPTYADFETEEEFRAIPWIAAVEKKADFIGFVTHGLFVVAVFDDGEPVPVAIAACHIGLGKLPTLESMQRLLSQHEAPEDEKLPCGCLRLSQSLCPHGNSNLA